MMHPNYWTDELETAFEELSKLIERLPTEQREETSDLVSFEIRARNMERRSEEHRPCVVTSV